MDRLLDMFRTAVNVTGDLSVATVMAKLEGEELLTGDEEDAFTEPLEEQPKTIPETTEG